MSAERSVQFSQHTLSYEVFGSGDKVALAWHGYGQSHQVWKEWSAKFGYRIVALKLFFHGSEAPADGRAISRAELLRLVDLLVQQEGIDSYLSIGFSIGSKYAITLATIDSRCHSLRVLAPDSLREHGVYRFATRTWLGAKTFKLGAYRSAVLLKIVASLARVGFVKSSTVRLMQLVLEGEQGQKLYHVWRHLRELKPSFTELTQKRGTDYLKHVVIYLAEKEHLPFNKIAYQETKDVDVTIKEIDSAHHKLIQSTLFSQNTI